MSNFIAAQTVNKFNPPVTKREPVTEQLHGTLLTDYYRWLEDKTKPEVIEWTKKQHDYTIDYLNKTTPDIPDVRKEIEAYIDRDIKYPPFFKEAREFFYRQKKGKDQAELYTRINEKEILIFDPLLLDPSGTTAILDLVLSKIADTAQENQYKNLWMILP